MNSTGDLTVSGKTRPIDLELHIVPHGNGQVTISTNTSLKMTDFGVKPPTAMLGMIKSGDAVNVKVDWELKAQQ